MPTHQPSTGPESIVVSLENAKKLKEAGWPQPGTLHGWYESVAGWELANICKDSSWGYMIAAPTAEEILRRLPEGWDARHVKPGADGEFVQNYGKVVVCLDKRKGHPQTDAQVADTLANAAAAMYCHLAENGLLPAA